MIKSLRNVLPDSPRPPRKTVAQLDEDIKLLEDDLEQLYAVRRLRLQDEGVYLCVVCKQVQVNPHDGYDTCELCARVGFELQGGRL